MAVADTSLVDSEEQHEVEPEKPRTNPMRFEAAEKALAWVFGSMASSIGFGAQNVAGGGGSLVWDDARIAALHMRMRSEARMRAAEKIRSLEWATAAMGRADFEIALLAFTPRGLPPAMQIAFKKGDGRRCLAAVAAIRCPFATELRDRRHEEALQRYSIALERVRKLGKRKKDEPTTPERAALEHDLARAERAKERNESVFEFLKWECGTLDGTKPVPTRIKKMRDWADDAVDAVIERFVPILAEREEYDYHVRAQKKERKERENVEHHAKLQPKRPETAEERIAALNDLAENMVHRRGPQ